MSSFQEDGMITFEHFLLAVSHNMDVLDADELEFNVGVVVFIFVAFSCSSVCDCIQLERHLIDRQNILKKKHGLRKCMLHNIDHGSTST